MNECVHVCRTLRGQKRASCLVELETKMVMNLHAGVGNQTQVLYKNSKCS